MSEGPGGEAAQNAGAAPGQRLREERERKGISTQKVAEALHVDPWVVEALEAGRFHTLGPPVYAKGHLRKYAALLGLDGEALVAECSDSVQPVPALSRIRVAAGTRVRRRMPRKAFVIGAIAVLAAVGVGWGVGEWRARSGSSVLWGDAPGAAPEIDAAPAVNDVATPGNEAASTTQPTTGTPPAVSTPAPAVTTPPPAAAPSSEPRANVRVRMSFLADSWVEIYDAEERRVFYDLGTANSARSVTVNAPARVALGNPSAVQIEINGQPVVLPVAPGRANVTHLLLDSKGRLRPAGRPAQR